ncbi:hypothetical protein DFH06DRAFT_1243225 [Mycena polygramma]|nr:hypothetical protein DFH06DRAFT_1243225 [Mycena polygramma]
MAAVHGTEDTYYRSPAAATSLQVQSTPLSSTKTNDLFTLLQKLDEVHRQSDRIRTQGFLIDIGEAEIQEACTQLDALSYRNVLRITITPGKLRVRIHPITKTHGTAAGGIAHQITSMGSAIHPGFNIALQSCCDACHFAGGVSKQPDWGAYPGNRASFIPSIVIEVAVSESYVQLTRDAELWLNSYSEVLTVIIIKVRPETVLYCKEVQLEKWKRNPATSVPEVTFQWRHGFQEIAQVPALVLQASDLFLPSEEPLWMAGQAITLTSNYMQEWLRAVLRTL